MCSCNNDYRYTSAPLVTLGLALASDCVLMLGSEQVRWELFKALAYCPDVWEGCNMYMIGMFPISDGNRDEFDHGTSVGVDFSKFVEEADAPFINKLIFYGLHFLI